MHAPFSLSTLTSIIATLDTEGEAHVGAIEVLAHSGYLAGIDQGERASTHSPITLQVRRNATSEEPMAVEEMKAEAKIIGSYRVGVLMKRLWRK